MQRQVTGAASSCKHYMCHIAIHNRPCMCYRRVYGKGPFITDRVYVHTHVNESTVRTSTAAKVDTGTSRGLVAGRGGSNQTGVTMNGKFAAAWKLHSLMKSS